MMNNIEKIAKYLKRYYPIENWEISEFNNGVYCAAFCYIDEYQGHRQFHIELSDISLVRKKIKYARKCLLKKDPYIPNIGLDPELNHYFLKMSKKYPLIKTETNIAFDGSLEIRLNLKNRYGMECFKTFPAELLYLGTGKDDHLRREINKFYKWSTSAFSRELRKTKKIEYEKGDGFILGKKVICNIKS